MRRLRLGALLALVALTGAAGCATTATHAAPEAPKKYGWSPGWNTSGGGGGGGSGTVTTSSPVSGDGSIGTPVTIANAAIVYAKIQNVAASSLLGNPTGSPAATSAIGLGTGLSFSGANIVCSACISADESIGVNNSTPALVTALERITTLTTNTAGSEVSDFEFKTLLGGAQVTALYGTSRFLGVNTKSTNLGGYAAGSAGLTIKAAGNGTTSAIEFANTNASATLTTLGEITVYNGATMQSRMQWTNNSATNSANLLLYFGASGTGVQEYTFDRNTFTCAANLLISGGTLTMSGNSFTSNSFASFTTDATPLRLSLAGDQAIQKSGTGGTLTLKTTTANGIIFATNSTTALTITGSQLLNFGTPSLAANGSVATTMTSLGPVGSHTTIQGWIAMQANGTAGWIPYY